MRLDSGFLGDDSNPALYGALSLAEILTPESASFARTGEELALGSAIE